MFPLVGIPEVWLVSGMCGLVLLLLGLLAIKALKKPILFKMGMRNAVRRPAQAVLIIFGLMLSTVFITTSLIMGNSVNDSFKTAQLPQVGNLDEGISKQVSTIKEDIPYFNSQEEQTLVATLRTIPSVNQFAGAIVTPQQSVPVFDITTQQISAENAVLAVPPDFGNVWGTLQSTDGHVLDFHQLASEEVYIGIRLLRS